MDCYTAYFIVSNKIYTSPFELDELIKIKMLLISIYIHLGEREWKTKQRRRKACLMSCYYIMGRSTQAISALDGSDETTKIMKKALSRTKDASSLWISWSFATRYRWLLCSIRFVQWRRRRSFSLSLSLLCCSTISTLIADQMFRLVERVNSIAEHSSSPLAIACWFRGTRALSNCHTTTKHFKWTQTWCLCCGCDSMDYINIY